MKLNTLIAAGLTATFLSTGLAFAQTMSPPTEVQIMVKNEKIAQIAEVMALVEALKAEGYTFIEISRTIFGRAKVMAYGQETMREIVMNTATGEILRDIMREHDGSMAAGMAESMTGGMEGNGGMSGGNGGGGMGGGNGGGGMGGGNGGGGGGMGGN